MRRFYWTELSGPSKEDYILTLAPKKAKKRAEGANSNVFSMFEQIQIQEFKEAFTIMDQNRDGFIDKNDLRDTFAALGRLNVKQEELDEMLKEAPGPINFTVFLTMFGEKLKGADAEETILNAFKVFDPEGKGTLRKNLYRGCVTACDVKAVVRLQSRVAALGSSSRTDTRAERAAMGLSARRPGSAWMF
ncbi:myosin regulatory light chain 2, ventricular/cardiac muscle isoform-like [Sinocyclocheilus grahami]|uniref:myosin regulatory light chain 2, ventricular/cardiac muscle isoform-like n=1 Tax=Sinocyclocheilus grahami TaxID=75366 RepID=UPI0007ACC0EC|nr:PREDICTED: myosin regulatory light chain 2, ventricular/cardiac muscle isoform-like [Sinocyclocheilus grahami]